MALKDEWKETGKGLGQAFAGLGKNIGRSAKTVVNNVTGSKKDKEKEAQDIADGIVDEVKEGEQPKDSTVFNDGSWRNTGKDLGNAFKNLGKSIVHSGKEGVDKVSDAVDGEKKEEKKEENK